MAKKKKQKIQWGQYIAVIFFILIGAVCGVLMAEYTFTSEGSGETLGEKLASIAVLLLGMYVAMFLQIIIHEAGHLLFGLLTGYRFSSFRIGSFMLAKIRGKFCFKRLSLAGTGGQCLMSPPDMSDGKIPYVLYNLGGSIMNVITAGIFGICFLLCENTSVLSVFLLMLAIIGMAFALMNGIPMRMGTVDNDGYNACSLGKEQEALRSFWVQMKVSDEQIQGNRLKDMPDEWFEIPDDEKMKNSMIAVMGVFACNRLMDQKKFQEADVLIDKLLKMQTGIVGIHKNLLVSDRIFCELIGNGNKDKIDKMRDKQYLKFVKSMKNFPSIIRTEYTYELLFEKNLEKAEAMKKKFDEIAKTYPYSSDIESERELMNFVKPI
ncbi:MAG: M50 family metallopeptidase [Schaedlerella sp.]|nr:M50 family metallopeptidase [Schaedlerella sp.]